MRYTPRSLAKKIFGPIDKLLFLACTAASVFGIVLIVSALTVPPDNINPGRNITVQIVAIAAGMLAMLIVSFFDYNILKSFTKFLLPIGVVLLLGTALFAPDIGGNRSWIPLGFINIQTSEYVKLVFIITLAAHIDAVADDINAPKNLLLLCAHGGIYILAVILQDDFGMAAVYILIFAAMMFFSGIRLKIILAAIIPVIAAVPFIWTFILQERHRLRIITMFNPHLDPLGMGYQVIQSTTAISNGGYMGMGYRKGYISQQANRLFAKHTDFIFSVCGEEFGFLGCMLIMLIFAVIILKIFRVRKKVEDNFGRMILIGISAMFLFQVVINIGMCVGLMPVVGITLPFISSGGSSMLSVWLAIGIVMSVIRNGRRQTLFDVK